jgi:hypothetical protein
VHRDALGQTRAHVGRRIVAAAVDPRYREHQIEAQTFVELQASTKVGDELIDERVVVLFDHTLAITQARDPQRIERVAQRGAAIEARLVGKHRAKRHERVVGTAGDLRTVEIKRACILRFGDAARAADERPRDKRC